MSPLAQYAADVVFLLALMVVFLTLTLVLFAILRRRQRERHFNALDKLRREQGTALDGLLTESLDYSVGVAALQEARRRHGDWAIETWLVEKMRASENTAVFRELACDLGLVERWQRRLRGEFEAVSLGHALSHPDNRLEQMPRLQFLVRARSAKNLGMVRHQPSWRLVAAALDDPHADVAAVAVQSLATMGEPGSFPALVERLHALVLGQCEALSLRRLKSALGSFPLELAVELAPSFTHPHPRIRFLAADIVRDMVERRAGGRRDAAGILPNSLGEIFLTRLACDTTPDVRARTAAVIAYLEDPRALPALARLAGDEKWFVRMHALRALARKKDPSRAVVVARRLTDPHWQVREAAVAALLELGQPGLDTLLDHFVHTRDEYCQEQTAEQLQRAGLIQDILQRWERTEALRERRSLERLVEIGKVSAVVAALNNGLNADARGKILERLLRHPALQSQAAANIAGAREVVQGVKAANPGASP